MATGYLAAWVRYRLCRGPLMTDILHRTAVKLFELSVGTKNPRKSKVHHVVMLAVSQSCYLTGSRGIRLMAARMPFELHHSVGALVPVMLITGRAVCTAKSLENQMQPPEATHWMTQSGPMEAALGKPEAFDRVRDVTKSIAHKVGAIADWGLMFHPGWSMPGVSKGVNGSLVELAGWDPSVTDVFELVKRYLTITGTCGMIAEGGVTCEGLARISKELWDRKPEIPGNEDGKVM